MAPDILQVNGRFQIEYTTHGNCTNLLSLFFKAFKVIAIPVNKWDITITRRILGANLFSVDFRMFDLS